MQVIGQSAEASLLPDGDHPYQGRRGRLVRRLVRSLLQPLATRRAHRAAVAAAELEWERDIKSWLRARGITLGE